MRWRGNTRVVIKVVDTNYGQLVDMNNVGCRGSLFIKRGLRLTSASHMAYVSSHDDMACHRMLAMPIATLRICR